MLFVGIFPGRLKYATIITSLQKSDKNLVLNYRLISVLILINKIFENVMYSRFLKHLKEHSRVSKYQFDFDKIKGLRMQSIV
jgi:hypothetical protein